MSWNIMLTLKCAKSIRSIRWLSTSTVTYVRKIQEVQEGNVTRVSVVEVPEEQRKKVFKTNSGGCALCTCDIPIKISYRDVLILEQFMREDGSVLPQQLTGLCKKQQLRVERCVMQAHYSGLFPDKTHPDLDRSGYRRFNRYWDDDMDLFRLGITEMPGTWYYIKRYNSKKQEFADYTKMKSPTPVYK